MLLEKNQVEPKQADSGIVSRIMEMQLSLDAYFSGKSNMNAEKEDLLKMSVRHHLMENSAYFNYCLRYYKEPFQDLLEDYRHGNVPLLPSGLFKRQNLSLLSCPEGDIIKSCSSSGTSGSRSIVPRDESTLDTFLGSITSILPSLLGLERTGDKAGFVLGPTTENAGDLWFSYVISCLSLLMQSECFQNEEEVKYDQVIEKLKIQISKGNSFLLIGPPFRILELAEKVKKDINFPVPPENSYIISAGGWKNRQREAIQQETFVEIVADAFNLKAKDRVRDSFNMVELNTVITECEHHVKHLPPWIHGMARDPKTNQVLPDGETGILSFLDASSLSYPGFILSEDFGYVFQDGCACGRKGQTIKIVRRMNNIEARGCALKMAAGKTNNHFQGERFFKSFYR